MRLIDADAFKAQVSAVTALQGLNVEKAALLLRLIDQQPTIDAAPVVRCRECRHSESIPKCAQNAFMADRVMDCRNQRGDWDPTYKFSLVVNDGYCDEGERRKEQNDG